MGLHDRLFKQLLRAFFADFLRLVAPELAERLRIEAARFLDKETFTDWPGGRRRELDLLAEIAWAGSGERPLLVHVEIEARARTAIGRRLWHYALQLQLRFGRTAVPIVLNLRGGRSGVEVSELSETVPGLEVHRFRYLAFSLAGCRAEDYLDRPEPLAWALAALMRPRSLRPAELKIACLKRIAGGRLSEGKRFLLLNCVETYLELSKEEGQLFRRLQSREENRDVGAIQMTWAEKMEARGVEKGIERGIEKGREQGLRQGQEQGLRQGQEQGLRQGQRQMLLGLLKRRFGPLPVEIRSRVEAAEVDALLTWADRLLAARSLDEVFTA